MPRPEYKTITVKVSSFNRFQKEKNDADNSDFLEKCLDALKEKNKKSRGKK